MKKFYARSISKYWNYCLLLFALFITLLAPFRSIYSQNIDSTQIDNSIEKCIGYFNHRIQNDSLYYMIAPLLIPLSNYYKLNINDKVNRIGQSLLSEEEKKNFAWYSALYDYKNRKKGYKTFKNKWEWVDALNLFALHCRKALTQKSFFAYADSSLSLGGYELTHVYLASLLLKNTRCICKHKNSKLENLAWSKMKEIIPSLNSNAYSDIEIETIALALYGGKIQSIDSNHIITLIAQQNEDGSWSESGKTSGLLKDHTSALALWAILEWKFKYDTELYLPMKKNLQ